MRLDEAASCGLSSSVGVVCGVGFKWTVKVYDVVRGLMSEQEYVQSKVSRCTETRDRREPDGCRGLLRVFY